ncbi:hypothetical protein Bca4012_044616 [Brassica carinata]
MKETRSVEVVVEVTVDIAMEVMVFTEKAVVENMKVYIVVDVATREKEVVVDVVEVEDMRLEAAMMSTTRLEYEHYTVGRARRRRWSGGPGQTRRAAAEKREHETVTGNCNGREVAKLGFHELQSKVRGPTKKMNPVKLATRHKVFQFGKN